MVQLLARTDAFLEQVLDLRERALLVVAALALIPALLLPLWTLTMFAPQYPEGLRLFIHSHHLDAGNGGQDLVEVNLLNHYIGMHELSATDFTEFKWIPFVIGGMVLLMLRAAVMGRAAHLVDVIVLYGWFGAFSMWSFASKLYSYGHNLAPTASVKVDPFMPPLFGHKTLANFEVYSYPGAGSYALAAAAAVLAIALFLTYRAFRRSAA